jgi:hemoglobin/transferrin/lactoferrin receptor protein
MKTPLGHNKYATIQFAVENLTDKFYRVFASGLSAPGRNLVITLRGKF